MRNSIAIAIFFTLFSCQNKLPDSIIPTQDLKIYFDRFNSQDNELYSQYIHNDKSFEFIKDLIPLIDIPEKNLEEVYYFRWWTFRKHIKSTPDGFVITEFLPDVSWSGKYNTINCPAGHHIYEGRWLRDNKYIKDYINFWLTAADDGVRSYSFWIADALLAYSKIHPDEQFLSDLMPLLHANYTSWESERKDDPDKLFWQIDDRDGMEFSASGRILNGGIKTGGVAAIRPSINSYMYGDAMAIQLMASNIAGHDQLALEYDKKAARIKEQVQNRLWNDSLNFFSVLPRKYAESDTPLDIRELIGYIPWYFNLPDDKTKYEKAWNYLLDSTGFYAPYGLTVCEQSHPFFEISYEGHECQWNGPSWPFATTQTLKAMSNLINNYQFNADISKNDFYLLLNQYAKSHVLFDEDGIEKYWIDENLNPFTGDWISRTRLKTYENGDWSDKKGGVERGKDYNHSSFCDLIISDLIGLKPQFEKKLVIQPMIPDHWEWFCLDRVIYHGKELKIIWDKKGQKYRLGKGFMVVYDGDIVFSSDSIQHVDLEIKY